MLIELPAGNSYGSVGRAVASDTRDQRFKSRDWQKFIYQLYIRKDGNKEKEAGNGPSLKTYANVWEAPLSKVIAHYWVETSVSLYKWEEIIVD